MIKKLLASAAAVGFALTATTALAADAVKIGVITTLTTPAAVLGNEQMNGFNLAMKHLGGKAGGLDIELIATSSTLHGRMTQFPWRWATF